MMTSPDGLALGAGEKIVWQSRGGGPAGYGQWVYVIAVLVSLNLCGSIAFIPLGILGASSLGGAATPDLAARTLGALPSFLCLALSLGLAATGAFVALKPRLRHSYFLTQERLIAAKLWGGHESWPLERIREVRQYVAVYHGRYGQRQEVATHRVELQLDTGAWTKVGPIADVQALLDLYENAVATRWVDLAALPDVGGGLAPGEARADLLFVARTRTAGMSYGPLFIGPSRLIRFTEIPEAHQLARLYSLLGRDGAAEELEELFVASARAGTFGHFVDLACDDAKPSIDGDVVTLRFGERTEPVALDRADADRARAFLAGPSPYRN
jgi:hypothetical protein